jgi:hypothetical protein
MNAKTVLNIMLTAVVEVDLSDDEDANVDAVSLKTTPQISTNTVSLGTHIPEELQERARIISTWRVLSHVVKAMEEEMNKSTTIVHGPRPGDGGASA